MSLTARLVASIAVLALLVVQQPTSVLAAEYDAVERVLGERTLALGSWGADVFTLQLHLRDIGYELASDGLFGRETQATVQTFQRDEGLPVTGRVDAATLEALAKARLRKMETSEYTVKAGDSLWTIARAFDTTMEILIEINELPNRPLQIGETLRVPALLEHTVQPGDSLWAIARRYQTDIDAIAKLNGISPEDVLKVGTVLQLPRQAISLPAEALR